MDKEQALKLVRDYKDEIKSIVGDDIKVMMFGSHAKGYARTESDIDVAVIVPELKGDWLDISSALWVATLRVDTSIEPVLMDECHPSPLYEDVLRTGIAV